MCSNFRGPSESRRNQKNVFKVVSSIFMKFWSRNNLEELDLLTAQDVYYIPMILKRKTKYLLPSWFCLRKIVFVKCTFSEQLLHEWIKEWVKRVGLDLLNNLWAIWITKRNSFFRDLGGLAPMRIQSVSHQLFRGRGRFKNIGRALLSYFCFYSLFHTSKIWREGPSPSPPLPTSLICSSEN